MQAGIQMSNFKLLAIPRKLEQRKGVSVPDLCPPPPSPGLGQHLVHKQEDGFLWWQLDAFPDDIHELGHRDVRGQQILPLVDVHDL